MKSTKLFVSLLGLLLPLGGAQLKAQESLLIGPGDLVHIVVLDAPELEQHSRVTDSGELPLIMGGSVKISGETPEQAADAIGKYMVDQKYLVNPKIAVTVEQFASQNISVIGEVRLPGAYPATAPKTVEEALALGGGLMPDADRHIIIQRHATGEFVTYYSSNLPTVTPDSMAKGDHPDNTSLRIRDTMVYPGDVVRVARAEMVFAVGDFGRPGGFPIVNNDANLTVLQLISLAGGANKSARLGEARLVHKDPDGKIEDIKLSLGEIEKGKQPDRVLRANDVLYVPFSFAKWNALGAVSILAAATNVAGFVF
jgi:polysaccharide export outer membrane protein